MTAIAEPAEKSEPTVSQHSWKSPEFIRVMLFIVPTLVGGSVISAIIGLKYSFMLKEQLNIGPNALGTLNIVLGIPSYLQPFIGAWTDMFAFFGYHRRSYYMAGKLLGAGGLFGLAALESSGKVGAPGHSSLFTVVCLVMLIAAGGIVRTVIFNAIMVALGNLTGRFGQLVAAVNLIPIIMGVTYTSNLGGYVADNWSFPRAFSVGAVLTLLTIPLVFLIDESRTSQKQDESETKDEHVKRLLEKRSERRRVTAAIRQAAQSPGLWFLVFFVFYLILTPGINNTKLYYERDSLHFSGMLIGSLGRYTNWGALAGYFLIGMVSRRIPVYMLAWGAWLLDCASYPVLLLLHDGRSAIIVEVGSAIIGAVYGVCLYTLAARLCPKGLEGVVYGLVMAAIALGGTLAEKIGGWLYEFYGPQNHHTLEHGWKWSCYFGFWFTVIAVVMIPFLPKWTRSLKRVGDLTDEDVWPESLAS